MFMAFEGKFRPNPHAHHDDHAAHGHHDDHHAKPADGAAPAHESPGVMTIPLIALATGAVLAGVIFAPYFLQNHGDFWRTAIERVHDPLNPSVAAHAAPAADHGAATAPHGAPAAAEHAAAEGGHGEGGHHVPPWVMWAPFFVTLAGFVLALPIYFFSQTMGAAIARAFAPINAFLSHKWYFDEFYDLVFVKGARAIGDFFWKTGDKKVIDGLGPDGFAWLSKFTARQMRKTQTGFVYHYSFFMLIAVAAIGAYAIWSGGGFQ
jgi:NADH-quinone oxidoreductase subunit L